MKQAIQRRLLRLEQTFARGRDEHGRTPGKPRKGALQTPSGGKW